ncbi:MAG TPA: hypothetical protein VKN14_06830 [Flavobacteriaceae bacterium]|nr:hypothetical protein [Flavobacteriaceae bacterium]
MKKSLILHAQIFKHISSKNAEEIFKIMIKNIASFFALSLTIYYSLLFVSFSKDETIDLSKYSTKGMVLNYTVTQDDKLADNSISLKEPNTTFSPYLNKCFIGFKEALAFKESGGNYFTVNTFGYLGKYQFGKGTLKMIGINNPNLFLNNPELQEKAFVANLERNKWILRRDIKQFVGKRINGVLITESGILAAAHLAGPGSVKKYLRSYGAVGFTDGYGTTIQYYIKKFSGYDTSFAKPNRFAKATTI